MANRDPIQPYQNVQQVAFEFWAKPVLQAGDGSYYCPGFEGPTYAANEWDRVVIGGYPYSPPLEQPMTPGICAVDVRKKRDTERKKPKGSDGERVTMHGIGAADIEIRITIWTPEQLRRLNDMWPVLFPKMGKGSSAAYDLLHPMFKLHDIKAVQFTEGTGPVIQGRVGVFTMRGVEFIKPADPKKKTSKTEVGAIGSKFDPSKSTNPTPGKNPKRTGPN
jgi:hypothetical protein